MDVQELRRIAAKEELSLNFVAKDEMLSKALLSLQGNDSIILKGGTAINRVYIGNKRFSEDIDLDMKFDGTAKEALKITNEIVKGLNFEVDKPRIMKTTIRYDLYYLNPLNQKDKIRLEFKPLVNPKNYSKKVVNFGFFPYQSALLNVYDIEELIKHKTECILNRLEGKDFFDLYYLLDLGHKKARLPEDLLKRIELEQKEIKRAANIVNHYIPRKQRPNWTIFLEELKKKIEKEQL